MDRKAVAQETLQILKQGYYLLEGRRVDIRSAHRASIDGSLSIPPEEQLAPAGPGTPVVRVEERSTVEAILSLADTKGLGVLNFASAKNPGGGFLNGAMAQEESLAASSGLYETQLAHPRYYERNRACGTMMYTDWAIYSPDVVFFRDGGFRLLPKPVTASVLTLPAVNLGQVLLKGEDPERAKAVMRARMARALDIFARQGDRTLVLGAYGCGVFRNDPALIARWWRELLAERGDFDLVVHAILDRSRDQRCLRAFQKEAER